MAGCYFRRGWPRVTHRSGEEFKTEIPRKNPVKKYRSCRFAESVENRLRPAVFRRSLLLGSQDTVDLRIETLGEP